MATHIRYKDPKIREAINLLVRYLLLCNKSSLLYMYGSYTYGKEYDWVSHMGEPHTFAYLFAVISL